MRNPSPNYISTGPSSASSESFNSKDEQQPPADGSALSTFYSLFEAVPFAVAVLKGPDLVIEFINQYNLSIWQRTKEEVLGKPLFEARPDIRSAAQPIHEQIYKTGNRFEGKEVTIELSHNGAASTRYFDVVIDPLKDEYSNIIGQIATSIDVTEKVLARHKLEQNATSATDAKNKSEKQQRLYETITNNTPDLIYVFDLQYRFTYANKALLDMWGKTWDEAIGKGLRKNGYEEWHAQMHEKEIDQVVATKASVRGEVGFPHATLGRRVYDYILVPVFGENGEVEAVAGTTRDITEIRIAEQSITESNERFRNLADESPMFVFIISADPLAPVSFWNKTWLDYTGQTQNEAIGRAWNGILHPEDIPVVMEHYTPAFENHSPYFIPAVRVKRHDGVYRWHAFKGNPRILANGTFDGYVGVGFDVHEQKLAEDALRQSEERSRLAIASAHLGTYEIDVLQQSIIHSPRTAEILGLDPTKQWPYHTFINTVHPEDKEIRNKALEEAKRTGDLFYEARILYPDGTTRWVRLNGTYLHRDQQPMIIGTLMDITPEKKAAEVLEQKVEERTIELEKANEALTRSNQQLARSNANLEEFAHAASHDMKEPIRKVLTFTDRLKNSLGDRMNETEKELFNRVENAAQRMWQLVDDLLEFSHVSERPIEKEEVDLNKKVANVLTDLEVLIEEKNAQIHIDTLPVVKGYKRQMQQLLQNLIGNAIKYSKKDEVPQINISSDLVTERGITYNQISIQDNGIGFEQQYADKIFQMFSRLHGKAEYSGTGVGLSIVKRVVENHDGLIRVQSTPDVGSTFAVLLPAG